MDKRQRLVMLGIAAVIAAAAVVIALTSGGGDEDKSESTTAAQTTTAETTATDRDTSTDDETATAEAPPEPEEPAEPEVTVINVKDGEPVDGLAKIIVKKGEQISITVVADAADHAHLHGYDVEKDVGPGVKARFREKADIEGIYELELHDSGAVLARITVEP